MLIHNAKGNYSFIKGIAPYSGGVIAQSGHEIVHARFAQPLPLQAGFERLRAHLAAERRPVQALCGMELRSPKPFTFQGFGEFNASYVGVLREWGVFVDGVNPIARTNIAPAVGAPAEPSLYGFSYTAPSALARKTFVVAGAGELPEGTLDPHDVVRRGETSLDALREKARFVMGLMSGRLGELTVAWDAVTTTAIYTVFNIAPFLESEILKPMGKSNIHGVVWYYSRPPIVSIEYEMDVRGVARELIL